jgi:hypothetical protein
MTDRTERKKGEGECAYRPAVLLMGCLIILGVGANIEHAQAQTSSTAPHAQGRAPATSGVPPASVPSSLSSPNVNPSSPNTTPQSNETPVSPDTPGTGPGSH